jgi:hypothetical protein
MAYPISVLIVPRIANRNRLTTAFRIVLALPHIILVGGVGTAALSIGSLESLSLGSSNGILGAIASLLAIVSWFTIVFSGRHVEGIRQFTRFVLQWRARSMAYLMLLVDEFPPLGGGGGDYPVSLQIVDPAGERDRLEVGLRLILLIPHFIVLFFVLCAWWVATIVAWFAILFTGAYPAWLAAFAAGALRWVMRVDGYLMLMVDEYPPFTMNDESGN